MNKAKQSRTLADMKAIGNALESYAVENNTYPKGLTDANAQVLSSYVAIYLRTVPRGTAGTTLAHRHERGRDRVHHHQLRSRRHVGHEPRRHDRRIRLRHHPEQQLVLPVASGAQH